VAARSAELRAAVQDAQGSLDGAHQHLQRVAEAALQHTPALSPQELGNVGAIRGRIAELAAAKALTTAGTCRLHPSLPTDFPYFPQI
jgi:hypothetical protein